MNNPNKSKEWLAGLIDADGYFSMSQKGYASLEITMDIRDKKALYFIKEKYGGSVKLRTGSKSKRYRLHHKKGLLNLIQDINGLIRNPIRLEQLNKVCVKYEWQALRASSIVSVYSSLLNYYNGWFSGFFDGDGSIYLSPDGIIISAANNVKPLQDVLIPLYGGKIYPNNASGKVFKWQITKKEDILNFFNNYFHICPNKSAKFNRFILIPTYFKLREIKAHLAAPSTINGKLWANFLSKWEKWE